MHQKARASATDLALIKPDRVNQAFNGGINIGIVENDKSRLTAQLQRKLLTASGGLLTDASPNRGRAGKRNFIHIGLYDHLAHCAITCNDIDDALG